MGWQTVTGDDKAAVVRAIHKIEPVLKFNPDRCAVDALALPFYQKGTLYKVLKEDRAARPLWYVLLPEEIIALDGSSANVHYANRVAPLMIDDANLSKYIKFYYFFTGNAQVFEQKIRRSAVGFSGKVWLFQKEGCFEVDINMSPRGVVTELDRVRQDDVNAFVADEFVLDA